MPEGLIVKALAGYYYVLPIDASVQAGQPPEWIQCRARGIFKKNKVTPLVGDRVEYSLTENGEGMVDDILPRRTELVRPPIANAELAVLVFAVEEPALNRQLLDKFLVHIEQVGLDTVICLTKSDLLDDPDRSEAKLAQEIENVRKTYEAIGYPVLMTSSSRKAGVEELRRRLAGCISVFSGQSGVGKSSLLNAMLPGLSLETNRISEKLGRGKHTTRHVELIPLEEGGWVADTPGFSQLDFGDMEAEELSDCFREFRALSEGCRFRGCLHHQEPGCAVRDAVQNGTIAETRYENYRMFLTELRERKRRY